MPSLIYPALLLLCLLLAWLMVRQAAQFLEEYAGPALTRLQQITVMVGFVAVILVMVLRQHATGISHADALRLSLLFAWGIPLVLLDWRCCWLPLRFTNGFWLSGLLVSLLPGCPVTLPAALSGSLTIFATLWLLRRLSQKLSGREGLGLGDVHLLAGLTAWAGVLPACLLGGAGFLLSLLAAVSIRPRAVPYAPWLFVLLASLALLHPLLLTGHFYDVIGIRPG